MILLSFIACSYDIFLGDSGDTARADTADSTPTPTDDSASTSCTIPIMATVDTAVVTVDWTALEPVDRASLWVYGAGDAETARVAACAGTIAQADLIDGLLYTGSEPFAAFDLSSHAGAAFLVSLGTDTDLTWVADIQPGGTTEIVLP